MDIEVNGKTQTAQPGALLTEVLGELSISKDDSGIAVAVNGAVLPRSEWDNTRLEPGTKIEIVHAVAGG